MEENNNFDPEVMNQKIVELREEKNRKRQQKRFRRKLFGQIIPIIICVICVIILMVMTIMFVRYLKNNEKAKNEQDIETFAEDKTEGTTWVSTRETTQEPIISDNVNANGKVEVGDQEFWPYYQAMDSSNAKIIPEDDDSIVASQRAVLINANTGDVVAMKGDMNKRIVPASMTKVMTVLVAVELIDNFQNSRKGKYDEIVTISEEANAFAFSNDCSAVGWYVGEQATVEDLLYGTILASGADAAYELAVYAAGSYDDFVDAMNEKAKALGISESTHFTNPVGLHEYNHYSTCHDIAIIMKAALENERCREILGTRTYTTTFTEENEEGIDISNWFLRRIEDKDTAGVVRGAKTGYVSESGCCAVSYEVTNQGTPFICVTANTFSSWRAIYDHVEMYRQYTDGVVTEELDYQEILEQ